MNKRIILFAALAVSALAGCKEVIVEPVADDGDEVLLNVLVPVAQTRTAGISEGDTVSDVQTFVFDQSGVLETYSHVTGANGCTLRCTKGTKDIVVLVNASSLSQIGTLAELLAAKSDLLEDNDSHLCVMEGRDTFVIDKSQTVNVKVTRHVAKVTLEQITLDFAADHFAEETFKIKAVYLVNVAGDRKYFSSDASQVWYNQTLAQDKEHDIIYDSCSDAILASDTPYMQKHQFYCYENLSVSDVSGLPWSPRPTRLVIEATLGNDLMYYPVTISKIKQNTAYSVKVNITRPGSSSPDIPVDIYDATSVIEVVDWNTGDTIIENI
ncbi:MAG: hypothetical protein IJN02_10580 [Bacteroidales bacterium]|nr:hypothetical protein [Bacteroidales bacterium]